MSTYPRLSFLACVLAFAFRTFAVPPEITNPPIPRTVFLGDPVTFQVVAGGTEPLGYQWFRNGTAIPGATGTNLIFNTTATDDQALFSVVVGNTEDEITSDPVLLTIDFGVPGPTQTNRLVDITAPWLYRIDKVDLGTTWTAPDYADNGWTSGGALLYVEESALPAPKTTPLPLTPGSLPTTCYFRTQFIHALADAHSLSLVANVIVDDGFVLHLNGVETLRQGMPIGSINYGNLAARTIGDAAWEGPFDLSTTNLIAGTNLIAVEVHQSDFASSDIVMGLTLDAIWQPRLRDFNEPFLAAVLPAAGTSVPDLSRIEIQFDEPVWGVDPSDLLINGTPATTLSILSPRNYLFEFDPPPLGVVAISWTPGHGIIDRSANSNRFVGTGFGYLLGAVSGATQLSFASAAQSTDSNVANPAARAVDGSLATFSLTADEPGSYWLAELGRSHPVERIEIVNRPAPFDTELNGLSLRLFNMDDQVVFGTTLTNTGPLGLIVLSLPPGISARSLWIGLIGSETNGDGNYRVGLSEVRLFGAPNLPHGPEPFLMPTNLVQVWQASEYGGYPASHAIDNNPNTFTHTANTVDGFWMADFGRALPIDNVEIVNRNDCCDDRLGGLVLRIYDAASNNVASTVLSNPGLGGTWSYAPDPGIIGRWLRVGLEDGQPNDNGNYYVTLAEARVFSGTTNILLPASSLPPPTTNNLASFQSSYMLRLDESVPDAANANDNSNLTETRTTVRTVDGYWEVDLGATHALYGVRAIAATGIGYRLTNAIVRLYDEAHESVFAQKLTGQPDVFDLDLNGPRFARFVRVGLEDKQRTDPSGGIEFYIGFREVEVFGRPTNEVGILSFNSSTNQVASGSEITLTWAVDDVQRVEIHPNIGSVGVHTAANGIGSLTLPVNSPTEFILVATNAAGLFSRAISVQTDSGTLPVVLSELVAENKYSLQAEYADEPDWIELRNPGHLPVNLTGWGLSDDPARPMKWVFPPTTLEPHGALIVFASDRAEPVDPAGQLHTTFRLGKGGGFVSLTASDGATLVDSVAYPELDADLAFGRNLNGEWAFLEPTPGRVNAALSYPGWLKELEWSHARGFYEAAFTLSLTNPNPDSAVLYSLDGSEPAIPYLEGIPIPGTAVVRIQAAKAGYKPARIQTKTFLFLEDVIQSSVMNTAITQNPAYAPRMRPGLLALPSVSISLPGEPEYEEKEGSLEILWPGAGDPVQVNCGISRFGNAWTKYDKRSIRMKCRARYGEAKFSAPLFNGFDRGVLAKSSFDKLDFRSGSQDMNERGFYMAGRFVEDTMLDMGSLNPHGRFVHLYLNGVYWGQYDCRELMEEHFLADYLGGASEEYVAVRGNDNVSDDFVLGAPDPPHLQAWEYARSVSTSFPNVRPFVDVSHLIDFMLLWNYGDCESEFRSAGPIDAGSGFKFWIADADGFLRTSALGLNRVSRSGPGGLFGGLVAGNHNDFKSLLADRIYKHFFNNGALTRSANDARLAARMDEIRDSLLAECARWGYRTPANWESAAADIRANLFPTRTAQLFGYLRAAGLYPAIDPPVFNQYGGLVSNGFTPTLTTSSGTIYYTLDGTDPRTPGGAISPQARIWLQGGLTITSDLTLTVRVRSAAGEWSALAQPIYLVDTRRLPGPRDLWITEIHYNPAGSDDFEFIELWNASTNLLDLSGVSLSNAFHFVFPARFTLAPGAFAIIVEDLASFTDRYQDPTSPYSLPDIHVAGQWNGALDNDGEIIALLDASGLLLSSIPFAHSEDWPERADGDGSSLEWNLWSPLEITDIEWRDLLADGRNWTASSLHHGSPGQFDEFTPSIRINEVLSHSDLGGDWIELLNSGTEPVDLTQCTLTDDFDFPDRWSFPGNTTIDPGEFLLLSATELGFAFSELGDHAILLQLNGPDVIRILDSVKIPAAAPDESLGTFHRSDGATDFTELRSPSATTPNALPRVGPIVISEIMFSPTPGKPEFLELANISSTTVSLFDPARPGNVWLIEGVGSFAFPPNTVMNPCSTLIIASTDPATFRAQYDVHPLVPVLGPWTGALHDTRDTLTLLRPGTPETDGTVPYYRVDHVTYHASTPWPLTTNGVSLERAPLEAYGNDPGHWHPGSLDGSPGAAFINRPPIISFSGNPVAAQGIQLTLSVTTDDPDAPWQSVTLTPVTLPPGSAFDPLLGTLTWTPSSAHEPGEYLASFSAIDDAACSPLQTHLDIPILIPQSLVLSAAFISDQPQLSFPALSGETYHLEFCTDLTTANWQLLQEVSASQNEVISVVDPNPAPGPARFYRVQWIR